MFKSDPRCAGTDGHYGCNCFDDNFPADGSSSKESLHQFIQRVESAHFRTDADTGANEQALLIWNRVRQFARLPMLNKADLPSYCHCCKHYHVKPSQVVKGDRGYEQSMSHKI